MIEAEGRIISTDGITQIWDPFTDKTLKRLNWQDANADVAVNNLSNYGIHSFLMSSHSSTMILYVL